ncbi:MAG: TlpA family protein disulfide reductase [Actinomycetales bacterium]
MRILLGWAVAAVLAASGCTAMTSASEQAQAGDDKGYVAGDGSVMEVSAADRGDPVVVAGVDTEGEPLSTQDHRGEVVVLNLWYAACGPCRDEAPDLADIAREKAAQGVQFIGIDTRDDPATAASFERTFDLPYPSIIDQQGDAVLALRGVATPNAVPTTIVLDRDGRVSARISGRVDPSTLTTLIDTALGENSSAAGASGEPAEVGSQSGQG